jgi:hypothetical protein
LESVLIPKLNVAKSMAAERRLLAVVVAHHKAGALVSALLAKL